MAQKALPEIDKEALDLLWDMSPYVPSSKSPFYDSRFMIVYQDDVHTGDFNLKLRVDLHCPQDSESDQSRSRSGARRWSSMQVDPEPPARTEINLGDVSKDEQK